MELEKTSIQDWVKKRIAAVRQAYSAFDCLGEHGVDSIPDRTTPLQMSCPFHGVDARPSARYYPSLGGRNDYLRCYKCQESWDGIALHAKFKGIRFMDALQDLERRFRIKIPLKPDTPEFVDPVERSSEYVSDKWADTPRVLALLEAKLRRLREKVALNDYIKFCRVIDAVQWDLDRAENKSTPPMVLALQKLKKLMEQAEEEADAINSVCGLSDNPEHGGEA